MDEFRPESLVAQRKRRYNGVIYWYITTVQNRVQAAMVRASLRQQGRRVQVSKKKTKMLGIEYDVWAADR